MRLFWCIIVICKQFITLRSGILFGLFISQLALRSKVNTVRYIVYTIYFYASALFKHATNQGQLSGINALVMLGLFQSSRLACAECIKNNA